MFANDGFKIRGWDETGLHVGSARCFLLLSVNWFKSGLPNPRLVMRFALSEDIGTSYYQGSRLE